MGIPLPLDYVSDLLLSVSVMPCPASTKQKEHHETHNILLVKTERSINIKHWGFHGLCAQLHAEHWNWLDLRANCQHTSPSKTLDAWWFTGTQSSILQAWHWITIDTWSYYTFYKATVFEILPAHAVSTYWNTPATETLQLPESRQMYR